MFKLLTCECALNQRNDGVTQILMKQFGGVVVIVTTSIVSITNIGKIKRINRFSLTVNFSFVICFTNLCVTLINSLNFRTMSLCR